MIKLISKCNTTTNQLTYNFPIFRLINLIHKKTIADKHGIISISNVSIKKCYNKINICFVKFSKTFFNPGMGRDISNAILCCFHKTIIPQRAKDI